MDAERKMIGRTLAGLGKRGLHRTPKGVIRASRARVAGRGITARRGAWRISRTAVACRRPAIRPPIRPLAAVSGA
jgi:hypothetical protein